MGQSRDGRASSRSAPRHGQSIMGFVHFLLALLVFLLVEEGSRSTSNHRLIVSLPKNIPSSRIHQPGSAQPANFIREYAISTHRQTTHKTKNFNRSCGVNKKNYEQRFFNAVQCITVLQDITILNI
jgi:hypothetical protein